MVGSAKNWHRQLSRATKTKWVDLLESFQTQYCGLGMSVARQYYHARKRSEETSLDYLYRLNVAALRAKLKIKDGNAKARREHVDHYVETRSELADRLTLLRLADVDELEEVLRARERAKSRQRRSAFGSKFRQKAPASAPTAPARAAIASLPQIREFSRSNSEVALDLKRGEARGYWKRHFPGKWFRQAEISGRINHERATLLLDTGAEVSILDTAFARKVGCNFDTSQKQECVRIGDNVYATEGRTKIKITLAGYLVYFFDIWIRDLSGQNAILGMDFMVPAGVRMELAVGSMRLHDEVGIPFNGRKRLYGENVRSVILERSLRIPVGHAEETDVRIKLSATEKLWVTKGERWIPIVTEGPGRTRYLVTSSIGDGILRLDHRLDLGMILDQDKVPRSPRFVSVWSRRYREWQNLALEATVDTRSDSPEPVEDLAEPVVPRPAYPTPRSILRRPKPDEIDRDRSLVSTLESQPMTGMADATQIEAEFPDPGRGGPSAPTTSPDPDRYLGGDAEGDGIRESMPDQATDRTGTKDIEPKTENQTQIQLDQGQIKLDPDAEPPICPTDGVEHRDPPAEGPAATVPQDAEYDEIYYHDSGDLSAEDLEGNLAVLPEIPISTTAKVSIEDRQVGDSGSATPEEIERLRQIIWKKRHLLIGKRNDFVT
ncbi:LOW QUALITY PROTEIN: hypothetical protein PHMEG_00029311 [Phytophthora megakarya]|uniref:Peptidase A2 domain-containing protein n=1 Tax=Phytophthora megakarya TaxID=4795 RepID=A0A225V4K4_9STRA|nr:LOW QUALITY PROTEIN: hypothetical protein PHMEG_00029311 [Phytophthora megakarya]